MAKTLSTTATRVWALQGYLAVNPSKPHWGDINFTSVVGWEKYQRWHDVDLVLGKTDKIWRDPRLTRDFSEWAFVSEEAGRQVLDELLCMPQKYFLRLICRQVVRTEELVAGYDIYPGTIVREPNGCAPTFMGAVVDGYQLDMPELYTPHACAICGGPFDNDLLSDICKACEARLDEQGSP